MPRRKRVCPAREVFHVLNLAVARLTIFENPEDYDAFLRMLDEAWREVLLPIFPMALTPNEVTALRNCIPRGCPFGDDAWVTKTEKRVLTPF